MLCASILVACAFGPFFPLSRVAVEGTHHVTVDAVVSASALTGVPAFSASAARARERVLRLPAVRDARVDIALPTQVRISVVERAAIGRWVVGGGELFVDDDGFLFASIDGAAAPALRVTDERGPRQPGERLDPALVAAGLKLARLAPGDLRADAGALGVALTAGANGLVVRTTSGWEVRFGGAERIDEKVALARRFLRENPQRKLDYLDVRTADSVVVSPR